MFTCQNKSTKDWSVPIVYKSLEDFKLKFIYSSYINHHEIKGTRYEQEIDDA